MALRKSPLEKESIHRIRQYLQRPLPWFLTVGNIEVIICHNVNAFLGTSHMYKGHIWRVCGMCLFVCTLGLGVPAGCRQGEKPKQTEQKGGTPMTITMKSEVFESGRRIPTRHTGDGQDLSPPLSWSAVPEGTKELALIVDDPDAPTREPWVHWVLYKIPADATALAEGIPSKPTLTDPKGAIQGKNTGNQIGYKGPAPPPGHGTHHYYFRLYALDAELDLQPGIDKNALLKSMAGHILAEGELVGTYER
jgi:hypothetical protein